MRHSSTHASVADERARRTGLRSAWPRASGPCASSACSTSAAERSPPGRRLTSSSPRPAWNAAPPTALRTPARQTTSPDAVAAQLARLQISRADAAGRRRTRRACASSPIRRPCCSSVAASQRRDDLAVALVGTRRASSYGRAVARALGARPCRAPASPIVSGLAKGIDTAAHRGRAPGRRAHARRARQRPGPGLSAENRGLAQRIVDDDAGALVSEFAPGVPPDAVNFPRRNRIISGLSPVTVDRRGRRTQRRADHRRLRAGAGPRGDGRARQYLQPDCSAARIAAQQGAAPVTCARRYPRRPALPRGTPEPPRGSYGPDLNSSETAVWRSARVESRGTSTMLTRALAQGRVGGRCGTGDARTERIGAPGQGSMLYTRT